MHYIFSIEGNIGSGKSKFLKYLKTTYTYIKNYEVKYIFEPVDEWNSIKDKHETIIEKFYKNTKKYSFSFQMMAYISKISALKKCIEENKNKNIIIICERCVFTDKNVFAQMLYDKGDIEHVNFQIYMKWFDEFLKETPISGYIYIKTTPEICLSRIHKRNRDGEEGIPLEYLIKCESYHNEWLNKEINIVTINGDENYDILPPRTWNYSVLNLIENNIMSKNASISQDFMNINGC
jgi:deoxyadenosine/deoxycytidine kinase